MLTLPTQILITDVIPEVMRTQLKYDTENDILPCHPHTCFFKADFYVNKRLMTILDTVNAVDIPLGTDTEIDWLMHNGIMQVGNTKSHFTAELSDSDSDDDEEQAP